jgi:hypothetical protein
VELSIIFSSVGNLLNQYASMALSELCSSRRDYG